MPAFMIAAAHKSSGKTVISTGLSYALSAQDFRVQCFKKGPDYIDPMWLSAASGGACYNLDFNSMGNGELATLFASRSAGADISLVEANKGLYDGVDVLGSDSNAQMAKLLEMPVVLVIDSNGITRGIAPLLLGYQAFDREVNIAGIILNKVGGERHEAKLIAAVKEYTDIVVLGAVHRNKELDIGERHLGLTTPGETGELEQTIKRFGQIIGQSVDMDRLNSIANIHILPSNAPPYTQQAEKRSVGDVVRIGVIRDEAFGFYYADDLEAFGDAGADLIEIDALNDQHLPDIDGLFIGGGFPEMRAAALMKNSKLRGEINRAIKNGLPTYAECGGLMYLCHSLTFEGQSYKMAGAIEADAKMHKRPQGRGYVSFRENELHPWGMENACHAHEFHYASLKNIAPDTKFVRQVSKGFGIDGTRDGIVLNNLVAGFCHLRHTQENPWVNRFVEFVRSNVERRGAA